ncbi:MAG: hypothetical protein ACOC1K_04505 [Nanoarchaeota archaeon]
MNASNIEKQINLLVEKKHSLPPHKNYLPYFDISTPSIQAIDASLINHETINEPCSMNLDSVDDLKHHINVGHSAAIKNYELGKLNNMNDSFPFFCCGTSSRNLLLSFFHLGYSNVVYANNEAYDHSYILLPFVLKDENVKGSILIDPTYKQLDLFSNKNVETTIKLGCSWEYKTPWRHYEDLYPDHICSIDVVKEIKNKFHFKNKYYKDGVDFFKKAFNNPLYVNVKV